METGAGGAEMADIGKEQGRGLSELFSDQPVYFSVKLIF